MDAQRVCDLPSRETQSLQPLHGVRIADLNCSQAPQLPDDLVRDTGTKLIQSGITRLVLNGKHGDRVEEIDFREGRQLGAAAIPGRPDEQ